MGNSYSEQADYLDEVAHYGEEIISKYKQGLSEFKVHKWNRDFYDENYDMILDFAEDRGIKAQYEEGKVSFR